MTSRFFSKSRFCVRLKMRSSILVENIFFQKPVRISLIHAFEMENGNLNGKYFRFVELADFEGEFRNRLSGIHILE